MISVKDKNSPKVKFTKSFVSGAALVLVAGWAATGLSGVRNGHDAGHACGTAEKEGAQTLKAVKVITERDGDKTRFLVENKENCEITMTFDLSAKEMQGSAEFPFTATFPAGQVTEAFSLWPSSPDAKWAYSFTNYFKLGSNLARHDDSFLYQLPYAAGSEHKVTQSYNGGFSHKGSNKYAIDWQMPEGTPVHAARGGVVVKLKDDSNTGGGSMRYDPYNNYVLIRHDDGTLAHYCHLQQHGVVVKVGQVVRTGELIAHSGNTGFSSGPHLHLCIFKTRDGRTRESIPVKFRSADASKLTLVSGRRYRAAEIRPETPQIISSREPRDQDRNNHS